MSNVSVQYLVLFPFMVDGSTLIFQDGKKDFANLLITAIRMIERCETIQETSRQDVGQHGCAHLGNSEMQKIVHGASTSNFMVIGFLQRRKLFYPLFSFLRFGIKLL